jgi:tRNA pseudouridine38-40 synthase
MNAAAERFRGEHDFAAFTAAGHGRLTTTRTIFDCHVTEEKLPPLPAPTRNSSPRAPDPELRPQDSGLSSPRRVTVHVSGSGFLYNMVRIIAGTLVEAGRGKLTPDDVTAAINSKDRRNAGPTLPPTGCAWSGIKYE